MWQWLIGVAKRRHRHGQLWRKLAMAGISGEMKRQAAAAHQCGIKRISGIENGNAAGVSLKTSLNVALGAIINGEMRLTAQSVNINVAAANPAAASAKGSTSVKAKAGAASGNRRHRSWRRKNDGEMAKMAA